MEIDNMLFFVLVTLIGFYFSKFKLIPKEAHEALPAVMINICYPAMILDTFTRMDIATLCNAGITVVGTLLVTLALFLVSFILFRRVPSNQKALLQFDLGVGNVTYVTIPLMSIFLKEEMIVIAILHGSVQDLLIWSIYHQLFIEDSNLGNIERIRKLVANPCLISLAIGILIMVFHINLPSYLRFTFQRISTITSPLALLFLGSLIHKYSLQSWQVDKTAIAYSIGKVIVLPICLYIAFCHFMPQPTAICLAILFASPAPVTSVIWSKHYKKDERLAVHCCIYSTVLFLILMSIVLACLVGMDVL